jgi:ATP-dependent phosphofructokinase / diphosphate-dependent phosphofructokinase
MPSQALREKLTFCCCKRRYTDEEYCRVATKITARRKAMSERIGIVTGGGDCPGLNAVIRAVAKAAAKRGWETLGFLGGYDGMLDPPRYLDLKYEQMGNLLTRGGTILGTANRGRFTAKVGHGQSQQIATELIEGVRTAMR